VGWVRPPTDADGRSWWPHDRAVNQLYGRLDTELAERLAARLRPQPQALYGAPHPPELPSAFLYAREDELFDDRWSRSIATSLLGVEAIELPGGHFPMLEHPPMIADGLEQVSRLSTAATDEPTAITSA
jgi:pimeloyl-ACP methyl ester carboxylesterase